MVPYEIHHDNANHQFITEVEGEIGNLQYEPKNDTLDMTSTFVPENMREKGIASALVQTALEYAKKENLKVKPTCPFVENYINEHEEYQSLVAS